MSEFNLETLRWQMIEAFHTFSNTNRSHVMERSQNWDDYCAKREKFLEQRPYRRGTKYVHLKETLIENEPT